MGCLKRLLCRGHLLWQQFLPRMEHKRAAVHAPEEVGGPVNSRFRLLGDAAQAQENAVLVSVRVRSRKLAPAQRWVRAVSSRRSPSRRCSVSPELAGLRAGKKHRYRDPPRTLRRVCRVPSSPLPGTKHLLVRHNLCATRLRSSAIIVSSWGSAGKHARIGRTQRNTREVFLSRQSIHDR
jgi:hypothetical protein